MRRFYAAVARRAGITAFFAVYDVDVAPVRSGEVLEVYDRGVAVVVDDYHLEVVALGDGGETPLKQAGYVVVRYYD